MVGFHWTGEEPLDRTEVVVVVVYLAGLTH